MSETKADWHHLGAFRTCPHGHGMNYTATIEGVGPRAVSAVVDAGRGYLLDGAPEKRYAGVLDIYDCTDSIVDDLLIPTDRAWQWWAAAIELQLTQTDCRECDPVVWQATDPERRTLTGVSS